LKTCCHRKPFILTDIWHSVVFLDVKPWMRSDGFSLMNPSKCFSRCKVWFHRVHLLETRHATLSPYSWRLTL